MDNFKEKLEECGVVTETETKVKIRQITCPHCDFRGAANMMMRFHFENCPIVTGKKITYQARYYRDRKAMSDFCLDFFKKSDPSDADFVEKYAIAKQKAMAFETRNNNP
jgi:hypothetical protein